MATQVSEVYREICQWLLEDNGLQLAYTEEAALADLLVACRALLQSTGMTKEYGEIAVTAGSGVIKLPSKYMDVQEVFWNGRCLKKSDGFNLGEVSPGWAFADDRPPEKWRSDHLPDGEVEITPKPQVDGTLGFIATVQSDKDTLSMDDDIEHIPDTFCSYLKFAVLEKIWSSEGESRDMARAAYCRARLTEAINAAKAIMNEELAE